jgi:hypothetical protein
MFHAKKPLLALFLAAALFSCKELEKALNADCSSTKTLYQNEIANQGLLSEEAAEEAPFPMSLILSQDSLNRMFSAVADNDIDPITVDLGSIGGLGGFGGVDASLIIDPDLPLIQFESVANCDTCIVLDVSFGLSVDVEGVQIGGSGRAKYQFPLELDAVGLEYTSVIGRFDESKFQDIDIEVSDGIDVGIPGLNLSVNDIIDIIEPEIKTQVNRIVKDEFGPKELFKLESWDIGEGAVKLVARGPILYPEHKTLVLGVHTNLVRPLNKSVGLEPALPEGADVGMQFHPELVQSMIQRMLSEGEISRSYDESGNRSSASGSGLFEVSFTTLEQSDREAGLLTAGFTVWRTDGFLCGSSEFLVDLGVSISDGNIALVARNLRAGQTTGSFGQLVSTIEDWIGGEFVKDMINISELTFNYREVNLPNEKKAKMSAETFKLEIGGNGFNIFLNLDEIL